MIMQIPWYIAALGAALIWGVHYPLVGFALQRISLFGVLMLTTIPMLLLIPFFAGELSADIQTFRGLPLSEQAMVSVLGFTSLAGAAFVYLAISSKNATLASLIEISYPVFVAFFSYLFFRHAHLNASAALGGLLVIAGAGLIIYNNP
jgi:drug/metabolite transporter (DMT)-like permease